MRHPLKLHLKLEKRSHCDTVYCTILRFSKGCFTDLPNFLYEKTQLCIVLFKNKKVFILELSLNNSKHFFYTLYNSKQFRIKFHRSVK